MADLIIIAIVVFVVGIAIRKLYRNHKSGTSSCGCGCSGSCKGCKYH